MRVMGLYICPDCRGLTEVLPQAQKCCRLPERTYVEKVRERGDQQP
jgi:hypothetical protein